jgi:hypothetical protein
MMQLILNILTKRKEMIRYCESFRYCHTPVLKEHNRSLHMCAQDVQITCMANNMVNRYNISLNYKLESFIK